MGKEQEDAEASPRSSAQPTGAPGAPVRKLPGRSVGGSALAAQVKLARLADLLAELSGIVREVAQESLAVHEERALMCDVNQPVTPARFLTAEDLAARLQVDARTIRRWRKAGKFPAGIELGDSVIRWRSEEVDAWLASGGNP